jgi:hypothetical protein
MPIACALIPREDLRPDQLEMLGTAMERWYWQQFADFGVALWIDYVAVTALRMGEMPQPLALRRSEGAGDNPEDRDELSALITAVFTAFPDVVDKPGVLFTVRDASAERRARAVSSLRAAIPSDLVKDMLLENRSWTASD